MDSIYSEWFKTDTVTVKVELVESNDFLTTEEIAELTGAPKNSDIVVSQVDGIIEFRVSNEIFAEDMYRYLTADVDGFSYHLTNAVLVLKEQYTKMGIGPRCVIKEIYTARRLREELPIQQIRVDAVGDYQSFHWEKDPLRGYYVWACMGFDAEIPEAVRPKLPQNYAAKLYISDLMLDKEGREEWLRHGESVKLAFDLANDSVSWKILSGYINERNIEL